MAIIFFIVDTSKILPSDYEYCIIFYPNCLVLELFHSEHKQHCRIAHFSVKFLVHIPTREVAET